MYIACTVAVEDILRLLGPCNSLPFADPFTVVGVVGPAIHARIRIRSTRQSFPPLYDRDISSGLCAWARHFSPCYPVCLLVLALRIPWITTTSPIVKRRERHRGQRRGRHRRQYPPVSLQGSSYYVQGDARLILHPSKHFIVRPLVQEGGHLVPQRMAYFG